MSLNKVFLLGNLTRDCELKFLPSGAAICEFAIATTRKYTQNNEQKEETCFTDITVFGKSAEACAKYLSKGSQAMVEGRLKLDQWDDKDTGKKRSKLSVIAENVQFVGRRQDNANQQQANAQGGYNQDTSHQGEHNQAPQDNGFPEVPQSNDDVKDDIPF